ncbi:hypothetical protein LTS18_008220 [Coniosporium uncinatum]|uniref:Uncharacterized protein n=1 Tax=Coniosporium uncinatum TaxID=93489 RepID=A0ACC3D1T4_9PEZI|nr:hypothetical protein LTS18_008220 [Coniosporium uncinatum]
MMFGPASGVFMRKWLVEDQKSLDLQLTDDKKGLGDENKTFSYQFTKPLNGSIGPKQTRCIINQTLEQYDLEKAVTVSCATQNPDVPSGNVFVVKTRYCLMWAPGNTTRLIATSAIEWTGKSWLKGPIEKGANDGQVQYAKDITAALRAAVTAKVTTTKPGVKTKGKGRRKKGEPADTPSSTVDAASTAGAIGAQTAQPNWGLLEFLRGPLGPLAGVIDSIFSTGVLVFILAVMVVIMWYRQPAASERGLSGLGVPTPARLAAYEQIWGGEEGELWNWLEERVGMQAGLGLDDNTARKRSKDRAARMAGQRLKKQQDGMSDREVDEAIKVTRQRLEALEEAVKRKKDQSSASQGKVKTGSDKKEL